MPWRPFRRNRPRWGVAKGAHPRFWKPDAVAAVQRDSPDPRRVCIVGAGIAGVHMAWLLRRRGFQSITVLERNDYVGGKVLTREAGGILHEMGGCYTTPAYLQVRQLLEDLDLYERVPVAGRTVVDDDGSKLPFGDWVARQFVTHLKGWRKRLPLFLVGLLVLRDIGRYNRLHRRIFGRYDGAFPPQPAARSLQELRGSFLDFLHRNRLGTLIPVMRLFQSAQGYGYLDSVPAYYGLLWNNPRTMRIVVEQLTGRARGSGADLTRAGMQNLVTVMAERAELDVRLGHEVVRIERGDQITVHTRTPDGTEAQQDYDLLFLACNARDALSWMAEPSDLEQRTFSTQQSGVMTTTLQRGRQSDRHGIDSWLDNAQTGRDHHVITQRLSRFFLDPEGYEAQSPDETDIRVTFQYGDDSAATDEQIVALYRDHYDGVGSGAAVDDHEVLARHFWRGYFPRWAESEICEGVPWQVQSLQGTHRTYWIGASACFESLRDIVNYNLLLAHCHFDA